METAQGLWRIREFVRRWIPGQLGDVFGNGSGDVWGGLFSGWLGDDVEMGLVVTCDSPGTSDVCLVTVQSFW